MQRVELSSLQRIPVRAKYSSLGRIDAVSAMARSNPAQIRPMSVGRVGGRMYVINEFETQAGLERARIKDADVLVEDYESMADLVAAHVRINLQPQEIEPLLLRGVVEYMAREGGLAVADACRILWIDRRRDLMAVLRAQLADGARRHLWNLLGQIAKKTYHATTPAYYITRIGKIQQDEQADAAKELCGVTLGNHSLPIQNMWLNRFTVGVLLDRYHRHKTMTPVRNRIADPRPEMEYMGKKGRGGGKKDQGAKPDDETVRRASRYIAGDDDLVFVPMDKDRPDMVFSKKTGRVAVVRERDGVYLMTDDVGRPAYMLSDDTTRYLGIDNGSRVFVRTYSTVEKAARMLAKSKKGGGRCMVISADRLPGR